MICPKCGVKLYGGEKYCPNCSHSMAIVRRKTNPNDRGGFGWGLLGFLVPVAGLVLFLVWRDEKPRTAKAAGIGALVSALLPVALVVLYLIGASAYLDAVQPMSGIRPL